MSGSVSSAVCSPFEMIKSRVMLANQIPTHGAVSAPCPKTSPVTFAPTGATPVQVQPLSTVIAATTKTHTQSVLMKEVDQVLLVVRSMGVKGLFRGLPLLIIRDFPGTGAFLGSYEMIKRSVLKTGSSNLTAGFVAGSIAGPLGWIVIYPVEIVRIHWQSSLGTWKNYWSCATSLREQHGWRVFFRGLPCCCLRSSVQISVTMAMFETLRSSVIPAPLILS